MTTERFEAEVGADISEFRRDMAEVDRIMRSVATGVEVDVRAAIGDFMRDIQRVQDEIREVDGRDATADIKANINDFLQDILQAKAAAQELDGEDITIRVKLVGDITDDVLRIKAELATLDNGRATVKVALDLDLFYTQINMVRAELQALEREKVTIKVDLNISGVLAEIAILKAALQDLDGSYSVRIDADTMAAIRALLAVRNAQERIDRNIFVKIWVDYTNAMKAYANTVQAFAEAGQQIIGGAMMALIPVLSQLLSALVGLLGSVGVMVGVLAGQFLVLASALTFAAAGFGILAFLGVSSISAILDETSKLNATQENARQALQGFTDSYDDLVKRTETPILQAFTSAMHTATQLLQQLDPFFVQVANSAARLMDVLNTKIDSKPIQDILAAFNTFGAEIFENMAIAIGNLLAGFLSLMAAFAPAAATWSENFVTMTGSFAAWAAGLSENTAFQEFVTYIQTYAPMIGQIFGNLIMGLVAFFAAFDVVGGNFITKLLEMTTSFRNWAETLGQNQQFQQFLQFIQASAPPVLALIGNLWKAMVNLLTAFAPLGKAILNATNAFLEWFNGMMETNKGFALMIASLPVVLGVITALVPIVISVVSVFGNMLGAIRSLLPQFTSFSQFAWKLFDALQSLFNGVKKVVDVLKLLVSPIGLVVAAVALFIAGLVDAYKNVESFRDAVDGAFSEIGKLAKKVFGGIYDDISDAIGKVVSFAQEQLAKFSGLWEQHGGQIRNIVGVLGSALMASFSVMMSVILTVIQVGWSVITGVFSAAWAVISGIVSVAIDLVIGVVTAGLQILKGDWEGAWNTISDTVSSIGKTIVSTLKGVASSMIGIGADIIGGLIDGIKSMFGSVASALSGLTDMIPSWVKSALGIHSPSRVMIDIAQWIPIGIAVGITRNLGYVYKATKGMVQAATPDFRDSMTVTKRSIDAAQKAVSKAISDNASEIRKIQYDAEKERNKISQDAINEANAIREKAADAKKKLTKQDEKAIGKIMKEAAEERVKVAADAARAIREVQASVNQDKLDELSNYAAKERELQRMSAAQEAAFWKYSATAFKDGTDEKIKATLNYKAAYEEAMAEQYNKEKNLIDSLVKYARYSNIEKLALMQEYMKGYEKGSEEQIAYEEQIYDAKVQIYNDLKSAADKYLSDMKSINQKLIDDEKSLRNAYEQTLNSRISAIKNTWGLFDEVSNKDMGEVDLLGNLRGQVETLQNWMQNLFSLESRDLDQGLIDELRALGPKAASEIRALTKMNASELDEYQKLWKLKTQMATQQATNELASERENMEAEVRELRINTAKELDLLQVEFYNTVKEITGETKDEFDIMAATLPEIGKEAISGLIDGMRSMDSALQATAKKMAMDVSKTLSTALNGGKIGTVDNNAFLDSVKANSGMLNGEATLTGVQQVNSSIGFNDPNLGVVEQPQVNLTIVQEWDGDQVVNKVNSTNRNNLSIKTYKSGQ